ncbi:MAG: slipin family protein [Pontiellaceae bacterium]|nr:slipin family protein [Pontiellaceae bacterium]MBN2785728.1 slipin family protein [Pontiellaceae bacterium]
MYDIGTIKIRAHEKGLLFKDTEFADILGSGRYWFFNPFAKTQVEVVSQRKPWLLHDELDTIIKSGKLGPEATVITLDDFQRALVWVDGRFDCILGPGTYVAWNTQKEIRVETVDARTNLFAHPSFNVIMKNASAKEHLNAFEIEEGHKGVLYHEGKRTAVLDPGTYATWKNVGKTRLFHRDLREKVLDVAGQEIMTADKVTLRMNAVLAYRISDVAKSVEVAADVEQSLYREVQLALRSEVGSRELDALLSDKDSVTQSLENTVRRQAATMGIEIISTGIKDIILPGEMKQLLNKVIEARKASEANAIMRREETAAMRSQMNTAKLVESNPALMRLRELEVLEKVATNSKLNIVTGEKGITRQVMNLL